MHYDIGACKNCRKITKITKDKKCEACGAEKESVPLYTWFHQEYDLIEDPQTVDKMDEMDNTEVKAAAVSGAEVKAGLRDMFIFFGIAIVAALLGVVCLKTASGSVRGRMAFMGLLAVIAAPILFAVGIGMFFGRIFSSSRAKKPEKAFELFWKAVFEIKTFSEKYENAEIAVSKITRSLPTAVRRNMDTAKMLAWISGLRNTIAESNGELARDSASVYKDNLFDAKGDRDSMTVQNLAAETVDEHKTVISADLVVSRDWSYSTPHGSDTDYYCFKMSAGILHVRTTLLKAGKYWYVPDFMPRVEKGKRVDAVTDADPEQP